ELGSQPGGWITAASTPPSSIRRKASSVVNEVTWRWAMLLGKPLPQRWIWASTMRITHLFVVDDRPLTTHAGPSVSGRRRYEQRRRDASGYDAPVSGAPHIRKVRSDELEEVWRVHVASSNDGMVRRGGPARRPADAPVASDARAALASDPDGYFCAVEEGQIRGMVSALVRGRVWYLSMFFVLPGDQGRGLGRALLERALAYGEARGTEIRCTWATLDPRAQARYVMAGMAPRW